MNKGLVDEWCDMHHTMNNISHDRQVAQRRVLRKLAAELPGPVEQIDGRDWQRFLAKMIEDGYHPHTVLKTIKLIKPFLRWMWANGMIDAERWLRIQAVKGPRGAYDGMPRPYTRHEIRRFWTELDRRYPWTRDRNPQRRTPARGEHWVRRWAAGQSGYKRVYPYARRLQVEAIMALALYAGLRRNEIYYCAIEDMHYENEYIRVVGAAKGPNGKPKVRIVPNNELLALAVGNWLEFRAQVIAPDHDFPWLCLWPGAGANAHTTSVTMPMSHDQFCKTMHEIAGGWEYHRLRHTFATERYRAGMPIEILQPTMGHANIKQTLGYARIDEDQIIAASKATDAKFLKALRPHPGQEAA